MSFLSLPPEIREMIYYPLLFEDHPITIRSPSKSRKTLKHKGKGKRGQAKSKARSGVGAILRTNKQIHDEASQIFYSINSFTVGIGPHGSLTDANYHGLKAFLSRVPARYVQLIKQIQLVVYLRRERDYWGGFKEGDFMTSGDAIDLQEISLLFIQHFHSLRSISVSWIRTPILDCRATITGMASESAIEKAIQNIITDSSVKELVLQSLPPILNGHRLRPPFQTVRATSVSPHRITGVLLEMENNAITCTGEGVPFTQLLETWEGKYQLR